MSVKLTLLIGASVRQPWRGVQYGFPSKVTAREAQLLANCGKVGQKIRKDSETQAGRIKSERKSPPMESLGKHWCVLQEETRNRWDLVWTVLYQEGLVTCHQRVRGSSSSQ